MSDAEDTFGRRDNPVVYFMTISDEDTAEDVLGYLVVESKREAALVDLEGVPWVQSYGVEVGDIHDAQLPWWAASKKLRVIGVLKRWDTGLVDLRAVEVA